jgi:hypothetical protein
VENGVGIATLPDYLVEGNENLRPLGKMFLWESAQEIMFREV